MIFFSIIFVLSASLVAGRGTPLSHGRIIGGSNATIQDNPWQVAVMVYNMLYCGGSLISSDVVVTAAHCAGYGVTTYSIIAGTNNFNNTIVSTKRAVKEIIVHEGYNNMTVVNDIALLKLDKPINFDSTKRAIQLADVEPAADDLVRVTGWGVLQEDDEDVPDILQTVDINIVGREECQKNYEKCRSCPPIDETMICAGVPEGGKDHCYGDSGGPVSKNGVLVGIVSWANGCAWPGFPGVNTNIAAVREWIREKVDV